MKQTGKTLVNAERHSEEIKETQAGAYWGMRPIASNRTYVRTKPVSIYMEEYSHAYKCKNCCHEWAETEFVERHRQSRPFPSSQALLKRQSGKQA